MEIAFSHQNFPAQFGSFGKYLAGLGWTVTFFTAAKEAKPPSLCQMVHMKPHRDPAKETHRFAHSLERAAINGQAFANAALAARNKGVNPDIVVGHSGWGSGTYAKAIWPDAKFVSYAEWYYRHPSVDDTGETQIGSDEEARAFALSRNSPTLLDLAQADLAYCPTQFQADQFPPRLRDQLTVLHDGVDCTHLHPDENARPPHLSLPDDAEIVTYVTRGMEPHRGFPDFMRAIERLQKTRPRLHVVIGGKDRVAYGRQLPDGDSWKKRMLAELDLDESRLHFTGLLPYPEYVQVLQSSHVHVYLTVPFVLSWSLIEAMAIGCALVTSNTAPLREALIHDHSADMVDHSDIDALCNAIGQMLDDRARASQFGRNARDTAVRRYDRGWIWPARAAQLETLAQR